MIVFHRRSRWWVEAACPGRWKHVSAVGFVPEANVWVALSWELARLRVAVVPDADFLGWFGHWCGEGAGVLRVAAPPFDTAAWRPRFGISCTSMVSHLLGLRRGALLPMTLWRHLVANGAEIATDGRPVSAHDQTIEADSARTLGATEC